MGKKAEKELKDKEKRRLLFDEYYKNIYNERWDSLKEALLKETQAVEFKENLVKSYYLDRASIYVASLLPLKSGDKVLDMCAAPGGKSLVLLSRTNGKIELKCNDRSKDRKARLDQVLREHTPESFHDNITTTCFDASLWSQYEKDEYDAILLDAPCSSERHVIQSEKHLSMWSVSRPKRLHIEQYALLASGFDALKPGGYLLYSTCSINMDENVNVIKKLIKRKSERVQIVELELPLSEKCEYGNIILPDRANNIGPLYACLIRKI